jgi:hypothetical protein
MLKAISLLVFIVLSAAAIWHAVHYHAGLPDQIREDAYAAGKSDKMVSKDDFLWIYLIVVVGNAVVFPGLGFLMRFIPDRHVNIPNKEHCLAPERRAATMDFMFIYMCWFGSATLLFVMRIFHDCFRSAQEGPLHPDMPLPSAVVTGLLYGGFILVWCFVPVIRYRKRD